MRPLGDGAGVHVPEPTTCVKAAPPVDMTDPAAPRAPRAKPVDQRLAALRLTAWDASGLDGRPWSDRTCAARTARRGTARHYSPRLHYLFPRRQGTRGICGCSGLAARVLVMLLSKLEEEPAVVDAGQPARPAIGPFTGDEAAAVCRRSYARVQTFPRLAYEVASPRCPGNKRSPGPSPSRQRWCRSPASGSSCSGHWEIRPLTGFFLCAARARANSLV